MHTTQLTPTTAQRQQPGATGSSLRAALHRERFRDALDGGELRLFFHPLVSLDGGTVSGVEALLCWPDPDHGPRAAEEFLPDLADTPMMAQATRWVLDEACRAIAKWPGWSIAVNISLDDLVRPGLVSDVVDALDRHGIEPTRLTLETTAADSRPRWGDALTVLSRLRSVGVVGLSLDNFGMGHSCLRYLQELPFTEVKIDPALVSGIDSGRGLAIATSVVGLASTLGIGVVADGVETPEQAATLRSLHCPHAQGHLWGVPTPAEQLDPRRLAQRVRQLHETPPLRNLRPGSTPPPGALALIASELASGASPRVIAAALNRNGDLGPGAKRWSPADVAEMVTQLTPAHRDLITVAGEDRRSVSTGGPPVERTHCEHGHALTPANTYLACRTCNGTVAGDDGARTRTDGRGAPAKPRPTVLDRALAMTDIRADGHWIWTGYVARMGPIIKGSNGREKILVRRLFFANNVRPLKSGDRVKPACAEPCCVAPEHMEIWTHSECIRAGHRWAP